MPTKSLQRPDAKLLWAILLNFLVAGMEVVGGVLAGSLSLLSDALHNLSDSFSLFISLAAARLSRRGNTESQTFGYKRAEILAALLNSAILLIVSSLLFKEALARLASPPPVNSRLMIAGAGVALAVNSFSAFLLHRDSRGDINIRSSYLHLLLDAMSSLAVIAGGGCVLLFRWTWIDPALTLGIGLVALMQGYRVVERIVRILMQSAPQGVDLSWIQKRIEGLPDTS